MVKPVLNSSFPGKDFVHAAAKACVLLRAPLDFLLAQEILAPSPPLVSLGFGACFKRVHDKLLGHLLCLRLACLGGRRSHPSDVGSGGWRSGFGLR